MEIMSDEKLKAHDRRLSSVNLQLKNGYKQTDLGVIPIDWELKSFKDVCYVNQGLQIAIEKRLKNSAVGSKTYITIQFLNNKKDIEYINDYSPSVCCDEDDVLMTRTGNTGIVVSGVNGVFHNNFFKINFNRTMLDKDYLIAYLSFSATQKSILAKAGTSTIPDLNHHDFYSIQIPMPSLVEQKTIAKALGDMEGLVNVLDSLITKKRNIKQGTMQQLLTAKTRLSGFTEKWEVKKLGEITKIISGGTPSTNIDKYWSGSIKWCTPTDVTRTKQKYLLDTEKTITESGLKNSSATLLPIGTLLLCSRATIGELRIANDVICTNQGFKSLICGNNIYNEFLYYLLQQLKPKLIEKAIGSTFLEISKKDISLIEIPTPALLEQQAIAKILGDMDVEIECMEQQRDKAELIKQGMMQELLTGKTRLI